MHGYLILLAGCLALFCAGVVREQFGLCNPLLVIGTALVMVGHLLAAQDLLDERERLLREQEEEERHKGKASRE